jgi:tetratricopeptide (TPR) repeat protein
MSDVGEEFDWAADAERLAGVVAKQPYDANAWYDLGLAHKYLGNWRESIAANERALALTAEAGDPAWWNLGIAATAVRDWELARRAWRGYGIDEATLPDGSGPIELDWGPSPLRLKKEPHEVVWGRRLDPARIRIVSIPFPESGRRWGDVVLHDGAGNGERKAWGRTYPVFDELERASPSEIPTLRSAVRCAGDADAEALKEAFEAELFAAEDWTANVKPVCKACSEGRAHRTHCEHAEKRVLPETRSFGIAAPMGLAQKVLRAWRDASPATRDFEEPAAVG